MDYTGNDFNVIWQGDEEKTAEEIIWSLIGKPLKGGLPVTIALIGHSRAGKSLFGLKIQDIVYQRLNVDFAEIVQDCVLIKPSHYADKIKNILEGQGLLKKAQSLQMDEAKFLLDSGDWHSFKNKAIRTIAATSASIKPIIFIIVAQMVSDIDPKTRRSIDYLFTVKRSYNQKPSITGVSFYEKLEDIDKVRIRPRAIKGIVHFPEQNQSKQVFPKFRPSLPRKEVLDKYLAFEQDNKKEEIFALLDQMKKQADELTGKNIDKLKDFAHHLVLNPHEFALIGQVNKKGKWGFSKDAKQRYNYGSGEFKQIEQFVNDRLLENKAKMELV